MECRLPALYSFKDASVYVEANWQNLLDWYEMKKKVDQIGQLESRQAQLDAYRRLGAPSTRLWMMSG